LKVSASCLSHLGLGLDLGPEIEGLGLEKILEGLGLGLLSDVKSKVSVSVPDRNVSFTCTSLTN